MIGEVVMPQLVQLNKEGSFRSPYLGMAGYELIGYLNNTLGIEKFFDWDNVFYAYGSKEELNKQYVDGGIYKDVDNKYFVLIEAKRERSSSGNYSLTLQKVYFNFTGGCYASSDTAS